MLTEEVFIVSQPVAVGFARLFVMHRRLQLPYLPFP
jgi:hypothetical protein